MILSLCSGYGGIDLAVERLTGDKTAFVADNGAAPRAILAHRFPHAANLGSITDVDWAAFADQNPGIDTITAGFPCQGLSNAGLRKGLTDERSAVWKHVAEAVRHVRPRLVFLENVAAIRSRGLGEVLADLATIGYDARWTCVRASNVGAPHRRDRWFCVATPTDPASVGRAERGSEPEEQPGPVRRASGIRGERAAEPELTLLPTPTARDWKSGASNLHGQNARPLNETILLLKTPTANLGTNGSSQHPDKRKAGGHGPTLDDEVSYLIPEQDWGDYAPAIRRWEQVLDRPAPAPTELGPRGGRRLTARFAEWMMGLPAGWVTDVPGLIRAQQLHAIGNGVVPQQAYAAYTELVEE